MASLMVGYKISKQCPKCNYDFGTYDTSAIPTADHLKLIYGSPFQKCEHCGKEYVDPARSEPAIHGVDRRHTAIFPLGKFWLFVVIGLFCAGMVLSEYSNYIKNGSHYYDEPAWWTLAFTVLAIGVVLYSLLTYKGRVAEAKQQMVDSVQRLQDPDYVSRLRRIGYVPQNFVFKSEYTKEEKRELRKHWYNWSSGAK